MRKVVSWAAAAAVAALALPSCAKNNIYPVKGKVTYNESPAAGAVVFFLRQGGDSSTAPAIVGIVQEDGSFELNGSMGKGAPPGDYKVLIEWNRGITGEGRNQHGPDKLQGRYADRKQPLLHAKVEAKTNDLPVFALTD